MHLSWLAGRAMASATCTHPRRTVYYRDAWLPTMQMIALEGRCFVISACQYRTRADCPADYRAIQGDDPATVLIRGGSCMVGPLGNILANPNFEGELIICATNVSGRAIRRERTGGGT